MSKKTVATLAGPWAIIVHIALTHVRDWTHVILSDHRWWVAVLFCLVALVLISSISLVLFRGKPRSWPWERFPSILGISTVSAVLLTASVGLEGNSADVNLRALSLASFEAAFFSFFIVLMKSVIVANRPHVAGENGTLTWWHRAKLGFREGQRQIQ